MTEYSTVCSHCFQEKGQEAFCPHCRHEENMHRSPLALPLQTQLNNERYLIGHSLGKIGGFGITYLAKDLTLQKRVAIKEFLPKDLVGRDTNHMTAVPHSDDDEKLFHVGLDRFLSEARTLATFDHDNVVHVLDFFRQNGTAYLVMDYYEGLTLGAYLKAQKGRSMRPDLAIDIMIPILDGLRAVHAAGILHRDIKPENIYLITDRSPILLDFGAARMAIGEQSGSLSVVVTPGFAPFEQYHSHGHQGVWTDIYSCAATLYHMMTARTPPEATALQDHSIELVPPNRIVPEIKPAVSDLIMQALATDPSDRPKDVQTFQDALMKAQKEEEPAPPPDDSDALPEHSTRAIFPLEDEPPETLLTRLKPLSKLAFVAAIIAAGLLFWILFRPTLADKIDHIGAALGIPDDLIHEAKTIVDRSDMEIKFASNLLTSYTPRDTMRWKDWLKWESFEHFDSVAPGSPFTGFAHAVADSSEWKYVRD